MSTQSDSEQILEVLDRVLDTALRELRLARAGSREPTAAPVPRAPRQRKSQTNLCIDILTQSSEPMHVLDLVARLGEMGVRTNRETLASALTKRLAPNGPFVRTAGNTFGLADREG